MCNFLSINDAHIRHVLIHVVGQGDTLVPVSTKCSESGFLIHAAAAANLFTLQLEILILPFALCYMTNHPHITQCSSEL